MPQPLKPAVHARVTLEREIDLFLEDEMVRLEAELAALPTPPGCDRLEWSLREAAELYAGLPAQLRELIAHEYARLQARRQADEAKAACRSHLEVVWSRP